MMRSRQYPPRAMSCLAVQLLLLGTLFLPAKAQNPLSLELVLKAIESGAPPQPELVRRITESGVSFSLDSQTRDLLMKKGAKAPLIQAIENARTARSSQGGTPNADVTVFSGEAIAGDEGPVTRERIFAVLRGNQDQALLAGLVSQYGIAFPFTPELGQEFRNAGANEVLLAELATAKVSTGAPDDSFTPLPLAKAQDYNGSERSGRLDIRLYVDGAAEVRVENNSATYKSLQGREPRNAGSEITGIFPSRLFRKLDITKKDGRGNFVVIERPTAENNCRLVIRIYDPKAGENRYHLRIQWQAE